MTQLTRRRHLFSGLFVGGLALAMVVVLALLGLFKFFV